MTRESLRGVLLLALLLGTPGIVRAWTGAGVEAGPGWEIPTGAVLLRDGGGSTILSGAPLARGETPAEALDRLIAGAGTLLGLDLSPDAVHEGRAGCILVPDFEAPLLSLATAGEEAVVIARRVRYRPPASPVLEPGIAVEVRGGVLRALLRRDRSLGDWVVVHIAVRVPHFPPSGPPPLLVPAARAETIAAETLARRGTEADGPRARDRLPARLVVTPGSTRHAPSVIEATHDTPPELPARLAWHVGATGGGEAWEVLVDPWDGRVLDIVDARVGVDIDGVVTAAVTPAPFPATPSYPAVLLPLGSVTISSSAGGSTLSLPDGSFVMPNAGTGAVDLSVGPSGAWITVLDGAGVTLLEASGPAVPPGPAALSLLPTDEFTQAQVDALHWGTVAHDFFRDRTATGVPGIDIAINAVVNQPGECAASFNPLALSLNFARAGATCVNAAFSNVVVHEYGHFVVDRLGLDQAAFGEGFGDSFAMLVCDDPFIGIDFEGPGTVLRDPVGAAIQYPCSGGIHTCGQILGSTWWQTRDLLVAELGPFDGLEEARQRFVDWSLLTIGSTETSGIDLGIATELLVLDDDDAFLGNGTPRFTELCAILAGHAVPCPPIPPVTFGWEGGFPEIALPDLPIPLTATITFGFEVPDPSTAVVHFREQGAPAFTALPLSESDPGRFPFTLPPAVCGTRLELFLEVGTNTGAVRRFPADAPTSTFALPVFTAFSVPVDDPLESDGGWSVGDPSDTATDGIWERVDPIGTLAAPEEDHTPSGTDCFVTGQGFLAGSNGADDVDGGTTTLVSPLLDLSAPGAYTISYWRWYSNDTGPQPNDDVFRVEITADDGANWLPVETVGPAGPGTSGGWVEHSFLVSSIVAPTATMRLRFIAEDAGGSSIIEAAIDDLSVRHDECLPGAILRRGDVTGEGGIDIADAIAALAYLFGGGPAPCLDTLDIDDDGTVNIADPISLLGHLFGGEAPPAAPYPGCGIDPTADPLDCVAPPLCP